jgi:hypothetical protein
LSPADWSLSAALCGVVPSTSRERTREASTHDRENDLTLTMASCVECSGDDETPISGGLLESETTETTGIA